MIETNRPRDLAEAIMDARYGVRFNELNERLFGRIDKLFTAISLLSGTAAVGSFLAGKPGMVAVAALVVAGVAILHAVVKPGELAARHNEYRRRYGELDQRAEQMSLVDFDAELRKLQADGPPGLSGLAHLAFARNLQSHGYPITDVQLSRWNRTLEVLV